MGGRVCWIRAARPRRRVGGYASVLTTTGSSTAAVDIVQLSHVLFQVEVSAEAFSADFALKGLLVVVRVHVERQVVDLMKRLLTNLTLVRLLAAVGQLVVFVVALLMETFPAMFAALQEKNEKC